MPTWGSRHHVGQIRRANRLTAGTISYHPAEKPQAPRRVRNPFGTPQDQQKFSIAWIFIHAPRNPLVLIRRRTSSISWSAAANRMGNRIASPGMFPEAEPLPHLICSRPMFIGGVKDEADQHGGA